MYVEKLDDNISQEFFDSKGEEWRAEQNEILNKIEQHHQTNHSYIDDGIRILELTKNVVKFYDRQEMQEKRRILNFVLSNCTWEDRRLTPNYRQPFDMLAVTNIAYQREKVDFPVKIDLFEIWYPREDSNPQPSDP